MDILDFVAARMMYQKIFVEAKETMEELFNCTITAIDGIRESDDINRCTAIYLSQLDEDGSGEVEEEFSVTEIQFWNNLIKSGFKIDFHDYDAVDACNFMQSGVFGKIVYG